MADSLGRRLAQLFFSPSTGDLPFLASPGWGVPHVQEADRVSRVWNRLHQFSAFDDVLVREVPALASWLDSHDQSPWVELPSGSGGTLDGSLLAARLTEASVRSLYFWGRPIALNELGSEIDDTISKLRGLFNGDAVDVTEIIGISGIVLEPGLQVRTQWGVIVPAPQIEADDSFGAHDSTNTSAFLMRRHSPGARLHVSAPDVASYPPIPEDHYSWRGLLIASLRMALGVAPSHAIEFTFTSEIDPFGGGQGASWRSRTPRGSQVHVNRDQAQELEKWAAVVAANHHPRLNVSVRRLSLLSPERDTSDRLIDAVIVWENLFGSSPETAFKVTGALAKLLCNDELDRSRYRAELSRIYSLRSSIVHGAEVPAAKVEAAAGRAWEVALDALRVSYERGPDWLRLESSKRSETLLLS